MGKILIVSAVFPPEPVVSAMLSYDIAMRLCEMGKEVVVVCPKPSRPLDYVFDETEKDYPFERVVLESYVYPESRIIGRTRESYSFGKAIEQFIVNYPHRIDAIYANTWALFSQHSLAKTAVKKHIPYFIHEQDIYPESYCVRLPKPLNSLLYKILAPIDTYVQRNATRIFTISPTMITYLSASRGIEKECFVLARNWQDDATFIESYKPLVKKSECCHIMYLGNVNPTANVTLVIDAMSHLDKEKFHLSIIGNGPDKEHCQEMGKALGMDITFGSVAPAEVASKQSEADILVLCLKKGVAKTATPSKLTAYMLTGRPIIASVDTDSDCADIIRATGCGMVVEPDNEEELRKAITTLAAMPSEELSKMGMTAFDYAKAHLSKETNLKIITDEITACTKTDDAGQAPQ